MDHALTQGLNGQESDAKVDLCAKTTDDQTLSQLNELRFSRISVRTWQIRA